tara:strand:- start:583 stop:939 length:357 start_codon:yes stop_codon:yes gene_type:complete
MAHFAKLGTENIVEAVEVVSNDIATNEQAGIDFLRNLYNNQNAQWVQTSYNSNIRKRFAGIGYTYDKTRDAFIPPKLFSSWTLNETTCLWEAPVAYPDDATRDKQYAWNETNLSWDLV